MSIKLLHFADLHLGVENYGRINPGTGLNSRFEDFARTLDSVVDYALDHDIDLVIFAGDAYKNRDPSPTHQRTFARALRRLSTGNVPTLVLVGNHDVPNTRGRAHAVEVFRVLEVPHVTVADGPKLHRIETKNGPVQVASLPHRRFSFAAEAEAMRSKDPGEVMHAIAEEYGQQLERLMESVDPAIPCVVAAHLCISGAKASSERSMLLANEPIVSLSSLVRPEYPIDYVALGHMHKHQDLNLRSYPPVVYSGSLERVDFGEENDEKGFVLINLSRSATTYEFIPVDARRFVTVECDLDSENPGDDLAAAIEKAKVDGAIVRLRYRVPEDKKLQLSTRQISGMLSGAFSVGRVEREISRTGTRQRDPGITDSLDTFAALERYVEIKPPATARDELLEYGRKLIQEFDQQEQAL